jgi:hypothetical protein
MLLGIRGQLKYYIVEFFLHLGRVPLFLIDFIKVHIVLQQKITRQVSALHSDIVGSFLDYITDAECSAQVRGS